MNKSKAREVCTVFNDLDFAISEEDAEKVFQYILRYKIAQHLYQDIDIDCARKVVENLADNYQL